VTLCTSGSTTERRSTGSTGDRFAEVAGGEAAALKEELFGGGLLEVDRRSKGFNYVVKRRLPDDSRPYFVVVRHKRRR
jgi:hypothetical protein